MKSWRTVVILASVAVLAWAILLGFGGEEARSGAPPRGAAELAKLPDTQLESAVLAEAIGQYYTQDSPPTFWRKLPSPLRDLWVSQRAVTEITQIGLGQWFEDHRTGATGPGPEELAESYAILGLTDAATVAGEIRTAYAGQTTGDPAGLQQRLLETIDNARTRTARQNWVRQHLAELVGRD